MHTKTGIFAALLITSGLVAQARAADVIDLAAAPDVLENVAANILPPDSPALALAFGLAPNEGLQIQSTRETRDGRQISRYVQTYLDVPVWGKQVVVTRSDSGQVTTLRGNLVQGIASDIGQPVPGLAQDDVVNDLREEVAAGIDGIPVINREKAELVVFLDDQDAARLAYSVEFLADSLQGGEPTRPLFIVDADNGEVLLAYDALAHQTAAPDCSSSCLLLEETGLSGSSGHGRNANPWQFFSVTIPSTAADGSELTIAISGGSGDADLYTRLGSDPTTSAYDCRPYLNGNNETCTHTVNAGETWHIGLYAYRNDSGLTLTASYKDPLATQEIGSGPGGNNKTGEYFYGPGETYGALEIGTTADSCVMTNTNVKTVDLNNGTSGSTAFVYGDGTTCYNNADAVNGAFSPLNDAHYFGGVVYNMYAAWLNTAPLSFQLTMRVHYGSNYENAFWDGSSMTFGDGGSTFFPLVSLDVSSHEVSHGFTEQNSNLIYSGQSGGMNEAFSDMAGEAAEYYMRGYADFLVGADIFKGSGALRSMIEPTSDGISIDNVADYYNGLDVHYSSGVFNKAFYELSQTQGWGVQQTFETFAGANMNCWVPDSTFQQGAQCVLDESVALGYDSSAVVAAFNVVGISLSPEPGVPGNLSAVAVSSGRVELTWNDVSKEDGYLVLRRETGSSNYDQIADLSAGTTGYADTTVAAGISYDYVIEAYNTFGIKDSDPVTVQVPDAAAIALSANTFKVKGVNHAELSWAPSGAVTLYIDGNSEGTINSSPYDDNTGVKGGFSRSYQVCSGGNCSDVITVNW